MDKGKLSLMRAGAVFILTMAIFIGGPVTIGAAEICNIVTIRGRDNIEPNMLTIEKGDCVVWVNFNGSSGAGYTKHDVQLSFKEGEKCARMTKAPVGFKMDVPSGCYITGWLEFGETASLRFTEPGTCNYEVQYKEGGKNSGTIVVK